MNFRYSTQIHEMYTMYTRITIALQVIKLYGENNFSNYNDSPSTMIHLATATSSKHAAP